MPFDNAYKIQFETLALTLDKQVVQLLVFEKSLRLAHRYAAEDRCLTSYNQAG
jgi:hypothetical protein